MEYIKYTVDKVIGNYSMSFDKKPLISKWNKPYKNCKVTFKETGTKAIKITKWDNIDIKIGDEFTGKIEEKEFNGNKYSELVMPKKDEVQANELNLVRADLASLTKRLEAVELYIEQHQSGKIPSNFSAENVDKRLKEIKKVESEDITPESIPW